MKFKSLEIIGFKSFGDRVHIKFNSGMTGIVGPNGCGKSNVADAIRWVLGEQSAKALRGGSMQDVIFNGTEKRGSLSYCEVSLFFDNRPDKMGVTLFPKLDYKEVVLTRKLCRAAEGKSGDAEYLINRQKCRLRDISELLREAQMGREGYSIIGQGRIDNLLSAKPEDRRAIFEEAAGISQFKANKKENENRLARVAADLVNHKIILEEKRKHLEPLSRQAEKARKHTEISKQLRHHEINLYVHQLETSEDAKKVIKGRLVKVEKQLAQAREDAEKSSEEYQKAQTDSDTADKKIETLRDELLKFSVDLAKQKGNLQFLNERKSNFSAQVIALTEENKKLENDHVELLAEIETHTNALEDTKDKLALDKITEERLDKEYNGVANELASVEGKNIERHDKIIAAMARLGEIQANMGRLTAEKEALISSLADQESRIKFLTDKLAVKQPELDSRNIEVDNLTTKQEEKIFERKECVKESNEARAIVNDSAAKLDKKTSLFHQKQARLASLVEIQERNENFGHAVKKLLEDAKKNTSLPLEGVVANLIKVKPNYEIAIETALAASVQHIVTKTEDEAKKLIAYLKEKKYGQATFLPISSYKPRHFDPKFQPLLKEKGVCCLAIDAIEFDKKYDSVMRGLLGGVVITDNIDNAVALAKKANYSFKIVTQEGEVLFPSGSITGGSRKNEKSNIFSFEREVTSLKEEVATLTKEVSELESLRETESKKLTDLQNKIGELGEEIHKIELELTSAKQKVISLSIAVKEEKAALKELELEMKTSKNRIAEIVGEVDSVAELNAIIESERATASEDDTENRHKIESLRLRHNALHPEWVRAKMTTKESENAVQNLESDIRRNQASSIAIVERLEYNHRQIAEKKAVLETVEENLKAVVSLSNVDDDSDRAKAIKKDLANLDVFKADIKTRLANIDSKRNALVDELQVLSERKNNEELQLQKIDTDMENMQNRVAEAYDLSYEQCVEFKDDDYKVGEGAEEAARLKRQLQALGHVNMDAMEEVKKVSEEYHLLDMQVKDIEESKRKIEAEIARLSSEMLARFEGKFQEIRQNFVQVFRDLFNGGEADLLIQEDENPLEAGIEILAQPPSKKLQSISLLSGGERALTAIAILFAILKLRPMPFCVLDEIEAALDDANAGRFAAYLKKFSKDTQFIVITHRKPTMETADSLFGVTMEEKGVSKVVSVLLSDALLTAETA